jgi:hypothetical protein
MDIENSNITTKEKIEKLTAMRNYSWTFFHKENWKAYQFIEKHTKTA